jgi:SAM-dependent methyltransferase
MTSTSLDPHQSTVDEQNRNFWNHICGSPWARQLGINDTTPESLKKFDDYYFQYYPYLLPFLNPERLRDRRVLEVGLGYGSVGGHIAQYAGEYTGLDIAEVPVQLMNHRLQSLGLKQNASRGSILAAPFEPEWFDVVVSIGCFHHTGNLQAAIDETFRILKPGGIALIMVYNKFSYRQWFSWFSQTWAAFLTERQLGLTSIRVSEDQRRGYDKDANNIAAPETVFTSRRELNRLFRNFSRLTISKQNCNDIPKLSRFVRLRPLLLPTVGRLAGLDLYITAIK